MYRRSRPVAMRVPPQRPDLIRQHDLLVEHGPGPDRALSHVLRPIRPRVSWLFHSMPMDRHVFGCPVNNINHNRVSLGHTDRRSRKLAVHRQDTLVAAQPVVRGFRHLE